MVSPSDESGETDQYWEQITEDEPLPITVIACDGDAVGEKAAGDIYKKISEGINKTVIVDLSNAKTITPPFIKGINAIATNMSAKIVIVVPDSSLRLDLASRLNIKVTVCKNIEKAEAELAEFDIDEIKKRLRRDYYNR